MRFAGAHISAAGSLNRRRALRWAIGLMALALVVMVPRLVFAESIRIDLNDTSHQQMGSALKIVALMTALSLAPAILMTTTCFVRIAVVFSFLRMALGTQNAPPQQVLVGLSLFLTAAIMAPTFVSINSEALQPYLDGKMGGAQAYATGSKPLRQFMIKQTRQDDLELFYEINRAERPKTVDDIEMHLLIPAFVLSELRTAFEMGFMLFIPFLVLDLIVASLTMALGLVMLPPAMLSLPLKVMVFVLADGWNLLVGSLVRSFA